MTDYYITDGPVRGECGHRHRSVEAAERCIEADHRGCEAQGGYSDRGVFRVHGGERYAVDPYDDGED